MVFITYGLMEWNNLTDASQLDELDGMSAIMPVLVYKHSARCNICNAVMNRLERSWSREDSERLRPHFVDVLRNREVSTAIAERYGITHESPQALVIRNGRCIYSSSHMDIRYQDLLEAAASAA